MARRSPQETGAHQLGQQLRQLRKARGWTQTELARRIQVERAVIGNYELGLNFPTIPALIKLAQALETSVDSILGLADQHPMEIQDRRLHQLFLEADRADAGTQGLVKQVVERLVSNRPAAKQQANSESAL